MSQRVLSALALVSLPLVACGSSGTPSGGSDTTPPAVISVTPANGAKGVTADASIVVTFSEPMDQASTQSAFQSGDLPAGGVTFSWNAGGTVLTMKPNAPLAYAKGNTFTQAAKTYAFNLTGVATDKAGNRLPLTSSAFSTLRDITATMPVVPALSVEGSHKGSNYGGAGMSSLRVGDSAANEGLRGYFTFDLSSIPIDVGSAPVAADIHLTRSYTAGTPYKNLNDCVSTPTIICASPYTTMKLEHIAFDEVGSSYNLYTTPMLHDLGSIATYQSTDELTTSVMVAVNDDLAKRTARGSRSQYRLRFPLESDNDSSPDLVSIYRDSTLHSPYLSVEYQIP